MKIVGATVLGGLWALEWAWHIRVKNLKFQLSIFHSFWDILVHIDDIFKFVCGLWALKWAWQLFLRSIVGIDENNTFPFTFLF